MTRDKSRQDAKAKRRGRKGRRNAIAERAAITQPGAFKQAEPVLPRPQFSFLSEADLEQIKIRALDLLEQHGVAVVHQEANAAMRKAGAIEGREPDRLRLPRRMVEEALLATPKQVTLCGRNSDRDIALPRRDGGFIMRTGTGAHGLIEPETGKYRNLMIDDVPAIARLANGLDQVGFIAHPFCYGVHELTSDIHAVGSMVANTDKHIWLQPYNVENVDYLLKIVTIAAGGEQHLKTRPIASCIMCAFTPLEFKVMDVEVLIQCGRAGVPVHACSLPSAAGTAPITVAGNVLMAVTEILAMITLGHVLSPGLPIIATPLMFTLDMRTGMALHACVESLQAKAMAIDVLKRGFGLVAHTYGAGSDTPDVDGQSMAERAMLGQIVALSGADILGGVGQLEGATVFSPVQAVLDNELGGFYRSLIRSPEINDETFNWQEISRIGIGSHFLDSPHTLKYCRSQHLPDIFQRMGRDDYEAQKRAGSFEAAREKAIELINADPVDGLPDAGQVAEIANVVAAADRHIIGKAEAHSGKREVI